MTTVLKHIRIKTEERAGLGKVDSNVIELFDARYGQIRHCLKWLDLSLIRPDYHRHADFFLKINGKLKEGD